MMYTLLWLHKSVLGQEEQEDVPPIDQKLNSLIQWNTFFEINCFLCSMSTGNMYLTAENYLLVMFSTTYIGR